MTGLNLFVLRSALDKPYKMGRSLETNILSESNFLERLRIEKRRVDRSKAPLSLVLFRLNKDRPDLKQTQDLLVSLCQQVTRETDLIGRVGQDAIALLLPDTDEHGMRRCIEKIKTGNGKVPYSIISATYPGDLFRKLLDENQRPSDSLPLSIEAQRGSLRFRRGLKRIMDVLGALSGIILCSPLMLFTAVAVKISSPGPIIFTQIRLGEKGTRFPLYKFRSMQEGADDQVHRKYVADLIRGDVEKINQGEQTQPLYKMKSDPRVTGLGRIIRKLSIDELPQFFNVLKGEMSLVGPRPPIPYEVEKYQSWHLRRILEVKPGVTGLWQVEGRSSTTFDDMVRLDLRYVMQRSLWLDFKILLKTIVVVLRPKHAA